MRRLETRHLLLALALAGCGTTTPTPAPTLATVTVTPASASLEVGATQLLSATARDQAGNVLSGHSVAWSSSAQAVASVSQSAW